MRKGRFASFARGDGGTSCGPVRLRLAVEDANTGTALDTHMPRARGHLLSIIHSADNFVVCDLANGFGFGWLTQDLPASGALGDARSATAAKGEATLAHGAKAFIELLSEVQEFQMSEVRGQRSDDRLGLTSDL